MTEIVSLSAAREHLRVGDEVSDATLGALVAAATQGIADHIGRPLISDDGWATVDAVPANVVHAIKLVLTELYDNRSTPLADITGVRFLVERYIVVSIG